MGQIKTGHMKYFVSLGGVRGIFAILIAIYHASWISNINSSDLLTNGTLMVDIFFVLSGFLMFRLYDGHLNSGGDGRNFIKRRFARVYPLQFFMLLVLFLYALARLVAQWVGVATYDVGEILPFEHGATETIQSFLSNLTLTQSMGFHDHLSYNMPSWSVSVEFWTYFVFLGVMLWARPKKAWHFSVIAILIGINYYVLSTLKPDINFHYDLGFWRCLGGFFTGVLVAYCYRKTLPFYTKLKQKTKAKAFVAFATIFEIFLLSLMGGFMIYFPGKAQFFIAPIAFVFVFGFAFDMGLISRVLAMKPFWYLAKISYSIYMVHFIISLAFSIGIELFFPRLFGPLWNATKISGDLLLIPYLGLVLLISHFTYKYVEMPGRRAILKYDFQGHLRSIFSKLKPSKT